MMSRYQNHKNWWMACRLCSLCERRSNVVLARGTLPAEVLFVGEAPGVSEDTLGKPFCGPAGRLLDQIIERAIGETRRIRYAITNLVACIPKDESGRKTIEPNKKSITACSERLMELYDICDPTMIVCVGSLAAKWVPKIIGDEDKLKYVAITHPAALLRTPVERQSFDIQTAIITLADAVDELGPF